MTEILPFLKSLISIPGLSGFETPVREKIVEVWRLLANEVSQSPLGSLHALRYGNAPAPRPRLLVMAHMDAVGLMVNGITGGFLHLTDIGGVDARILPGQLVIVHGRQDLPAVVVQPSSRLLPPGSGENPVGMDNLLIDTGLLPEQVTEWVQVGDRVSFAQPPIELGSDLLAGHSLDNRASVAALTLCLEELQTRVHAWDVWAVASVQEEETLGGAQTSPVQIRPDLAIAVDVTFAKGPSSNDYQTLPLGKGVGLGWGPNIHPALYKTFKELAERLEIPYKIEPMPHHSGTDAIGMQVVTEGIPCMVLSIPLRYMHTPVEVVSLKDIQRAGRLLAEFIARLDVDFMKKINWEA
jgi:putative aminopeptidase FrvX